MFFVTGEVKLLKVLPLSLDIISFPLFPTEKNLLLPNVIPYNVLVEVPELPDDQLLPLFAEICIAPTAPLATNLELPNVTS